MRHTPYQTYLAERLQFAKGLGWEMPVVSGTVRNASISLAQQQMCIVPPMKSLTFGNRFLRFWFRFAG